MTRQLGVALESEIAEQPDVWRRIARSGHAREFANAVSEREVVLVGSGSSLFVAMLAALALRRRHVRAAALAATEAGFERGAYCGKTVIALSQSGRSADLLAALDVLEPERIVALTNTPHSPLGERAHVTIDIEAGPERAVPATKSVSAMAAIALWGAGLVAGRSERSAVSLNQTASDVEAWLASPERAEVTTAAGRIARRSGLAFVGAGYSVPIALELALKTKEASYLHAEGFAAGEFRHGSSAMLDATTALLGIVDDASRDIVRRPLEEAKRNETLRYTIGGAIEGVWKLGPQTGEAFNTLAWLVAGQCLALDIGRARGVDGDTPRGLTKVV